MKGYYSSSNIQSSNVSPNQSLNDIASPFNSPIGGRYHLSPEESILMRYLRSGIPSNNDYSSPNKCNPIVNYEYHKSSKSSSSNSGGGSSRSVLSAVENLERSPVLVKVEEDVLVMDGILVDSKIHKGVGKSRSLSISDFSGNSSSSSSNSGSNPYKTELCPSWEDAGACRYGRKCQFAHGKEELRPTHTHSRNKSKLLMNVGKRYLSSPESNTFSPITNFAMDTPISKFKKASPIQMMDTPKISPKITSIDWSPLDDGIEVTPQSSTNDQPSSREDVHQYIHNVLYGPTQRKRLPVFVDICP